MSSNGLCLKKILEKSTEKYKYFHHYTTRTALTKIFENNEWKFSNIKYTNDLVEIQDKIEPEQLDNLFSANFSVAPHNSLSMFKMYSNPIEDGVVITFPSFDMSRWISKIKDSYEDSTFHLIAYISSPKSNEFDNSTKEYEMYIENKLLEKTFEDEFLLRKYSGYIKNLIWSYEQEARILINIKNSNRNEIMLKIEDEILEKLIITPSPWMNDNKIEEIRKIEKVKNFCNNVFCNRIK